MNIRPGQEWGAEQGIPADVPVVATDHELAAAVSDGHDLVALDGGDMWRTLGGRGGVQSRLGTTAWVTPIDLATVELDGADMGLMAAHVIAHNRWWSGQAAAVMNAQWWGDRDMAPRSHPGDGRLDALVGSLPARQLLQARTRVRSGQHVPHPAITTTRPRRFEHTFPKPRGIWIDGVHRGRGRSLLVEVLPGAVSIVV